MAAWILIFSMSFKLCRESLLTAVVLDITHWLQTNWERIKEGRTLRSLKSLAQGHMNCESLLEGHMYWVSNRQHFRPNILQIIFDTLKW